jgi:hypothetical protein
LRRIRISIVLVVAAALVAVSCSMRDVRPPNPITYEYKNQVLDFADPCLEKAIRRLLERPDREIWSGDLAGIERLHIRAASIDLNGKYVEYAPGRVQMVTLTDLKWFTGLRDLAFVELGISSDLSPLAQITGLKKLDLEANEITDITPLATLSGLTDLCLSHNLISELGPLAALTNLTNLHLGSNRAGDVSPLAGLADLQSLEMENNHVYDIRPLARLANLRRLVVSNNYITNLPTLTMPHLTYLDLSHNQILNLGPLSGLMTLRHLELDSNQIKDISPLATLSDLSHLSLNSNYISDLSPLGGLRQLRHLEVCGNNITDWSPVRNVGVVIGETEQLMLLGRQIVEAIYAKDCLFLRNNARNVEICDEGVIYYFAAERIEVPFPKDRSRPNTWVRFVNKKTEDEIVVGYEVSLETSESVGVFQIGFVKRDGVWKMEWVATDI